MLASEMVAYRCPSSKAEFHEGVEVCPRREYGGTQSAAARPAAFRARLCEYLSVKINPKASLQRLAFEHLEGAAAVGPPLRGIIDFVAALLALKNAGAAHSATAP